MASRNPKRKYLYGDADFKQLADSFVHLGRRDLAQLSAYGITDSWLDELAAAIEAFADAMPDYYWRGGNIIATAATNKTREQILDHSQHLLLCAQQCFASNATVMGLFVNNTISRLNNKDLYRKARSLSHKAQEHAVALAAEGFGAARLAEYQALIANYNTQINAQRDAILERTLAVHERIALGNTVYEMLLRLSAKGRLCWEATSPARYKDYVLYPKRHQKYANSSNTAANSSLEANEGAYYTAE